MDDNLIFLQILPSIAYYYILEGKVIDFYVINNFLPEFILYLGRKGTLGSLLH